MKKLIPLLILVLVGCATTAPPKWNIEFDDGEYEPYKQAGTTSISGQGFLKTVGGDVKVAAGSTVTLDPVTSYSRHWWQQAGKYYARRNVIPPDPRFREFRKTTVADAEGRFKFRKLPAGSYYVRTTVTWETGRYK